MFKYTKLNTSGLPYLDPILPYSLNRNRWFQVIIGSYTTITKSSSTIQASAAMKPLPTSNEEGREKGKTEIKLRGTLLSF